jgi:uncharacterized protein YndB with AHSA1/START domain
MAKNISRLTINATAEKVWETLTKPGLVKLWQFGSDLITSWRVGEPIRFRNEWQGNVFEQWGTVLECKEPGLLRYTLFAPGPGLPDVPENYFVMTYVITAENGKTTLEIIQEDNRPGAVQEPPQGDENPVLQSLQKLAESA